MPQNVSFLGELFKGVSSGVEEERKRNKPLDILELMIRHKQLEDIDRKRKEEIEIIQRSGEPFPQADPFAQRFPELIGRSRGEAMGLIPSLLSSEAKREQREKPRPLTSFESQQIISLAGSGRRLNKISKDYNEVKNQLGPLNPKARSQLFLQLTNDPKFAIFKKDVLQEFNEYRKRITGAQAVFKEIQFLQEASLDKNDPPEIFLNKLNDFIDEAEFNRNNLVDILQSQNKPVPKSIQNPFKSTGGIGNLFQTKPSREDIISELQRRKKI